VARGYHVVNIDIDSVYFLELPPYLDMDKDQAKSVNGRSQLRIDTIPVRGKASTVTVLRPMLLMETRIATGAMWLLFDMGSCRGIAFGLDKSVS
jgi:hypothetical protein